MKVINLKSENVKRIRAIDITPNGNTVKISGKNKQGKTSILDSIWFALAGKSALKNTPRPIRDGETKAKITLDLGKYKVTRSFTENNTYVSIENGDGATFKSPQAILDSLIGDLSFDPLAYLDMDSKKQLEVLLGFVELPFDPRDIDDQIKDLYDKRAEVGRIGKQLSGQIDGMDKPKEDTPDEGVDVSAVFEDMRLAQEKIKANDVRRNEYFDTLEKYDLCCDRVEDIQGEIDELKKQIVTLSANKVVQEKTYSTLKSSCAVLLKEYDALEDPDLDVFSELARTAEEINEAVMNKEVYKRAEADLDDTRKEYAAGTKKMEALQNKKTDALTEATFPVDGLGFDENGVTFDGKPFTQASGAEQLRVSLAMAMALNPQLKVIHIKNGSLLDSENMQIIEDMAKDKDYQVWIEVVDESGKVGIYIEDGEVKQTA